VFPTQTRRVASHTRLQFGGEGWGNNATAQHDYTIRVHNTPSIALRAIESVLWNNMRASDPWFKVGMEELPDFEAAFTVDARVTEQVHRPFPPSLPSMSFHRHLFTISSLHIVPFLVTSAAHDNAFCFQVLHSFVSSIGLDHQYTLIVISPRPPAPGVSYGYRYGFSQSELNHLRSSDSAVSDLLSRPPRDAYASSLNSAHNARNAASSGASVAERSEAWARRFFSSMYGSGSIDVQDALHSAMPEKLEEWFAWHRIRAGAAKKISLFMQLATNMLRSNLPVDRAYIESHVLEAAGSAGCLTEAWISAHRFAWIDLTAGRFTWGTGTGAKGADSFPHVPSDFFSGSSVHNHDVEATVLLP
jgi:hypothetical protein